MRATVYVVAAFHRWGDELRAFGVRKEAESFVMEYASVHGRDLLRVMRTPSFAHLPSGSSL